MVSCGMEYGFAAAAGRLQNKFAQYLGRKLLELDRIINDWNVSNGTEISGYEIAPFISQML